MDKVSEIFWSKMRPVTKVLTSIDPAVPVPEIQHPLVVAKKAVVDFGEVIVEQHF